jgi:hypothetical protein
MKIIIFFALFASILSQASVVGISTHPLNQEARVLSAEMLGYLSQRQEVGMGLRYTQEIDENILLDAVAAGAQESRGLTLGMGADFAFLREDVSQPRVSIKPYFQYQRFDQNRETFLGAAPTMRKGFSFRGQEFFPYLAIPTGMRLNNQNDEFDFYASMTLGASMPFPGARTEKLLLSLEANKDLGSSSDYLGCLISWVWN